jgi:hypothetical protein
VKSDEEIDGGKSDEIDGDKPDKDIGETIAYFKINDELNIVDVDFKPPPFDGDQEEKNTEVKWSIDISNLQKNGNKYFILVAISRIDVDEDMKGKNVKDGKEFYKKRNFSKVKFNDGAAVNIDGTKKGTAIYRFRLVERRNNNNEKDYVLNDPKKDTAYCYFDGISGICRFVEDYDNLNDEKLNSPENNTERKKQLKRFKILNFHGIYNFAFDRGFNYFNLNEKHNYPKSVRHEFDHWYTAGNDCMERLLSCIYDKYFFVKRNKGVMQSLEGKNIIYLFVIIL